MSVGSTFASPVVTYKLVTELSVKYKCSDLSSTSPPVFTKMNLHRKAKLAVASAQKKTQLVHYRFIENGTVLRTRRVYFEKERTLDVFLGSGP